MDAPIDQLRAGIRPSVHGATAQPRSFGAGAVVAGRYRLLHRVGAGGMATIFRGRDETLERDVAVKVLHAHLADDLELLERFRAEARSAAALLHPNIVNVFDQGVEGLPFIVMEYVDGPSLRDVLLERGRLRPAEALAVVEPVCAALARAHAAGVVHRDIKPENVLVAAADGTVKVADFGIARAIAAAGVTQTGALIGSVHYLAPELVDGREATPASDQYAVGVLLFELLTGRKPLPADSPMAIALRHAREDIPAPSRFVSDVGRDLDRVVARATARDPSRRYSDVRALADALADAVPSGPAPVAVSSSDDGGREHTLVIPADAQETTRVEAARSVARRSRRPRRRLLRRILLATVLAAVLGAGGWLAYDLVLAPVRDVPAVIGQSQEQAAETLSGEGFELVVADERAPSFDIPEGAVVDQQPDPGAGLRAGRAVIVTLSSGRAVVEMPDVLGNSREAAVALLESEPYRFSVQVEEAYSDTVPAGQILDQQPDATASLRAGDPVVISVSLGVERVAVPDLSGLDETAAGQALTDAGLQGEFSSAYSDEQPAAGVVATQSIPPGEQVERGSTVQVVISAGPATLEVPNLRGDDIDDAVEELEDMGLQARVIEQERPQIGPFRRGEFGRVEEQLPQPGERVARGGAVDLYTFSEDAEY